MVGIVSPSSFVAPRPTAPGLGSDERRVHSKAQNGRAPSAPDAEGRFPFTEDHATRARRGHALLRLTSPASEAAFELHPSRRCPARGGHKETRCLNDLAGYRVCRSDVAKLTACRKVRGMYRP